MIGYREILKVVWPLALGMVNNAVMQFVDRAYLANESMEALEAILPASMLSWIFLGFAQSIVGYSGVFVAQYHGAGDSEKCAASYYAALIIAVSFGLLMLPLIPFGRMVFSFTAASSQLCEMEYSYYGIIMAGGFFACAQVAAASYFTGIGFPAIVFWVNLIGNLVNIAIDPLLIFGYCGFPALGIEGAAYATVFSMALQWIVLFVAVRRKLGKSSSPWEMMPGILKFGIPAGAYSVLNVLSFSIFVFVTGAIGAVEFAVSNACFAVNYLIFAPMEGFALGAQTLVGQARGRGDDAGAMTVLRRTLVVTLLFVAFSGLAILVFHRQVLSLFSPEDERASVFYSLGFVLIALMVVQQLFDAVDVVLSGALKGAGDTRFVMWWMLFCAFGLWLPMVFAVRMLHNTMPFLWGTMVAYTLIICAGSLVRWKRGYWRRITVVERR